MAKGDQATTPQIAGPAGRKKSKLKLIILVVVIVLVLAGGGAAAYFFLLTPKHAADAAHTAGDGHAAAPVVIIPEPEDPLPPGAFVALPDVTVNLITPDRRNEFLRLGLTLELTPPGLPPGPQMDAWTAGIQARSVQVIDILQPYLRELHAADLRGSAGTYRLHEQVLYRVKLVLPDLPLQNVHFRMLIVQ